jgi:dienelactone hydrolase
MNPLRVGFMLILVAMLSCGRTHQTSTNGPNADGGSEPAPTPKSDDKKPDDTKPVDREEHARAFITTLAKEDFKAAAKDFDEEMVRALPPESLAKFWKDHTEKAGTFKSQGAVKHSKVAKYDVVVVTCEFDKMAFDVRVVYDADGKIGGFFVDLGPPSYAKKDAFRETEVTVKTGEWSLPGTLTIPKGDGPFPAVVLLHGSGPLDRDSTIGPNKVFRDLAWGLASQGIAVLRYQKRTKAMQGKVEKAPDAFTLKEETIDDAVTAVELLSKQKEIDKKRIFLVGHSLGAFAAPRVAQAAPDVAGLVLLAANSRPLEDLILEQITYVLALQKAPEDEQKKALDALKKQVERVKDPKLSPDTPPSELPFGAPAAYWLDLRKYDPTNTAAKLKHPMLILQGERDYQVTMVDFDGWKKTLAERKNVRLKSYPNLNHLFMVGEGKAKPAEYEKPGHIAPEVIDDIAEWIKKQ